MTTVRRGTSTPAAHALPATHAASRPAAPATVVTTTLPAGQGRRRVEPPAPTGTRPRPQAPLRSRARRPSSPDRDARRQRTAALDPARPPAESSVGHARASNRSRRHHPKPMPITTTRSPPMPGTDGACRIRIPYPASARLGRARPRPYSVLTNVSPCRPRLLRTERKPCHARHHEDHRHQPEHGSETREEIEFCQERSRRSSRPPRSTAARPGARTQRGATAGARESGAPSKRRAQ